MKNFIIKWYNITRMMLFVFLLSIVEYFESQQWYRKQTKQKWYFVCSFETGEEYWTINKPMDWDAMIITVENYEV